MSKYELGQIVPSRSMLMLLYPLAETPAEKSPIITALGQVPEEMQVMERQLERDIAVAKTEMDKVLREMKSHPETRRRLLSLALKIGREPEIPLWIPDVLSFWSRFKNDPHMRDLIDRLETEVVEKLHWEEERGELEGLDNSVKGDRPHRVMIRCPQTLKPVFTGVEVSPEEFNRADIGGMEVFCPHCQITHRWNKAEAFLEAV